MYTRNRYRKQKVIPNTNYGKYLVNMVNMVNYFEQLSPIAICMCIYKNIPPFGLIFQIDFDF